MNQDHIVRLAIAASAALREAGRHDLAAPLNVELDQFRRAAAKEQAPAVPYSVQLQCVERELGYRRRVYARRVEAGQMTRKKADQEIQDMEAVRDTLSSLALGEKLL